MSAKDQKFIIGRDRTCDVPIADESVSRVHAELLVGGDGKLFLTDCRSTNGTTLLLNGHERKLGQEFVAPDDNVRFGKVTLRVRDLLETVRSKFPQDAVSGPGGKTSKKKSSLQLAEKLIRCECGAVMKKGGRCKICGSQG